MQTTMYRASSVSGCQAVRARHAGKAFRANRLVNTPNRRTVVTSALEASKPGIAQFADSIGLPTDEGLFGFKPFSEVWCGRLAMMGFISSILVEFQTGQGTLQQLGIGSPSNELLAAILGVAVGGSVIGAGVTAYRGFSGKMTKQEANRYKQFLLLENEEDLIASTRKEGTAADRFFAATNPQEIEQAKAAGSLADRFLSNEDGLEAAAAAKAAGTPADAVLSLSEEPSTAPVASTSAATSAASSRPAKSYDDIWFSNYEMKYAREVEVTNGRSAMVGFLAAVLVEAATGKGILLQLIMWGKLSGLLGYASGF